MTFTDVILWVVGASWLFTAIMAIQEAGRGDRSLLKYIGSVALIAIPLCLVFPGSVACVLGLLWVATLVIPGLLLRHLQTLMLKRRFPAAIAWRSSSRSARMPSQPSSAANRDHLLIEDPLRKAP